MGRVMVLAIVLDWKSKGDEEPSNAFNQRKKESFVKIKVGLLAHSVLIDLLSQEFLSLLGRLC